jgi:hypothetical protein
VSVGYFAHGTKTGHDRNAEGRFQEKVRRKTWLIVRASDGVPLQGCVGLGAARAKLAWWNERGPFAVLMRGGVEVGS